MPGGQHLAGRDPAHRDMHVDAIHDGSADAVAVELHLPVRARARLLLVAVVAAGARVGGRHQHEPRREVDVAVGAREGDPPRLQRLADALKNRRAELGELVEEQHAVVRERYLAGTQGRAAADQPRQRGRVMRAAKRPHPAQDRFHLLAGDRVHHRRLDGLGLRQRRQDGRQPRREHGLARTGRSRHQHAVAARRRDLQGALRHVVAGDVPKVKRGRTARLRRVDRSRERARPEPRQRLRRTAHQPVERDEALVDRRAYEVDAQPLRAQRVGQQPGHRAHRPLERQLAHEQLAAHRTRV